MKRIRYDGLTLVTGSDTADALVTYAADALASGASVRVDLPILEESGLVRPHTLVFGPGSALDVVDLAGRDDEAEAFPVPDFPALRRAGKALPKEEVLDLDWTESA